MCSEGGVQAGVLRTGLVPVLPEITVQSQTRAGGPCSPESTTLCWHRMLKPGWALSEVAGKGEGAETGRLSSQTGETFRKLLRKKGF